MPDTYPALPFGHITLSQPKTNAAEPGALAKQILVGYLTGSAKHPIDVGISMGLGMSSPMGTENWSGVSHYSTGVMVDNTTGSAVPPSLKLQPSATWRFRWSVKAGRRRITIKTKQIQNGPTSERPSLTVKKNPSIGIPNDVSGSAPFGSDWVTIGPVVVTPTSTGAVWVEIKNNLKHTYATDPTVLWAYFDHVVVG